MSRKPAQNEELLTLLNALCNDNLGPDEHRRLQELLLNDAEAQRTYLEYLDLHLVLRRLFPAPSDQALGESLPPVPAPSGIAVPVEVPSSPVTTRRGGWRAPHYAGMSLALAVLVACGAFWLRPAAVPQQLEQVAVQPIPAKAAKIGPRVAQMSNARFMDSPTAIHRGAVLDFQVQYALVEGMLELTFSGGASVIIQAPAVFDIADENRLSIVLGRCSVYAADGAQGFQVNTPTAEVVDLGTRFSVDVGELGSMELQVIEGLAEVHPVADEKRNVAPTVQLSKGEARRYSQTESGSQAVGFDRSKYVRNLPDRIVTYTATKHDQGIRDLESVSVQRGGKLHVYQADEMIGFELIHFRGGANPAGLVTDAENHDPQQGTGNHRLTERAALSRRLSDGFINPGGSKTPLTTDPVLNDPDNPGALTTPGMGIRFHRPIVNSAGPDVVFFDLQLIVYSPTGDAFHISPLAFRPGLRTHTIRKYEIDMTSPEAQRLVPFRVYRYDHVPQTITELFLGHHCHGIPSNPPAKIIATSIDLSDLGYAPGEAVEGLFFQDILDDSDTIDPVFIGGLPPVLP